MTKPYETTKIKQKKLLIGLVIVVTVILFALLLRYLLITSTPQNIIISNLGTNSVSISWTTNSPTNSKVIVYEEGGSPEEIISFDDRDLASKESPNLEKNRYRVHHTTVKGLEPDTKYVFEINNGVRTISSNEVNSFKTAPESDASSPTLPEPAYGKIVLPEENFLTSSEAVIYLTLMSNKTRTRSSVISAVVDYENDTWYLDINSALTSDLGRSYLQKHLSEGDDVFEYVVIEAGQRGKYETVIGLGADAPANDLPVGRNINESDGGMIYLSNSIPRSLSQLINDDLVWYNEIVYTEQEETGSFTNQKQINTCRPTHGSFACRGKYPGYVSNVEGNTCVCTLQNEAEEDRLKSNLSACECIGDSPESGKYQTRRIEPNKNPGGQRVHFAQSKVLAQNDDVVERGYELSQGFNMFAVDFELQTSGYEKADAFLQYLNTLSPNTFLSIAQFDSGKWEMVGYRNGEVYGSGDFKIEPGQGYMIRTESGVEFELEGEKLNRIVKIEMQKGWNLIGLFGTDEYTAVEFINDVKSNSDFLIDHVTEWDPVTSRFKGIQKEDDQVYGFDFILNPQFAYFTKVIDGDGIFAWNPLNLDPPDDDPPEDDPPEDDPPEDDPPEDDPPNDLPPLGDKGPEPVGKGIWVSQEEIEKLPSSGTAWGNLKKEADKSLGAVDLSNQDDSTDIQVLAKALVYAKTKDNTYRVDVINAIMDSIGTEDGGRTLALGRNLAPIVIAADLVNLSSETERETIFREWLQEVREEDLDGKTLISTHEDRPNNWGTHAGSSRAAVAAYLDDHVELERTAKVFHGWLGNRTVYSDFSYGDLDWQCDPEEPVGINPKDCTKEGHSIDGVIPDDQRRDGAFEWPPPKENYVWEGLQGAIVQAEILYREGYPVYEWEDQALLRAVNWLHTQADFPAEGDDNWQPWIINYRYGSDYPAPSPSSHGKNMGFTDWTHAK